MTGKLVQQSSRHAVYVQRFGGHLANLFDPYMEQLIVRLREIMASAPETTQDMREINRIIAEYRKASIAIYGEYSEEVLLEELSEFSVDESIFAQEGLQDAINTPDFEATRPSDVQIWAAIRNTPLVFPDSQEAKMLEPFIRDWERGQIEKVNNIIRTGFITGKTNQQIVQDIAGKNGYLKNQNTKSIKSMVRTVTNHTSNIARQKTYQDNDDIVVGYEWVSTLDIRTSSICRSLDGTIYKYDNPKRREPPAHPNALVGGSMVTTENGVVAIEDVKVGDAVLTHTGRYMPVTTVMCKSNDTLIRKLILSNGVSVSLTDDHPVLTSIGWKVGGDIEITDKLFYNTNKLENPKLFGASFVENRVLLNSHDMKTSAVDELVSYGIFSSSARMSSSIKLDSDVSYAKISNIPSFDDLLELEFNSMLIKEVDKNGLMESRVRVESFSKGSCCFSFSIGIVNGVISLHSLATCFIGSFEGFGIVSAPVSITRGVWRKLLASVYGVLPASCVNSELSGSFSEGVIGKAIFSLNKSKAFSLTDMFAFNEINDFLIGNSSHADNSLFSVCVMSIVEYHTSDYVYNISVAEDETYYANGVLVHNCRSTTAPALDARFNIDDDPETRASKGVEGGQQVNANKTYYSWLKEQGNQGAKGRAFVEDVLGKERAKLFLDGGLTAEQFKKLTIDELFQPIPLSELRKKKSLQLAFDKIG